MRVELARFRALYRADGRMRLLGAASLGRTVKDPHASGRRPLARNQDHDRVLRHLSVVGDGENEGRERLADLLRDRLDSNPRRWYCSFRHFWKLHFRVTVRATL